METLRGCDIIVFRSIRPAETLFEVLNIRKAFHSFLVLEGKHFEGYSATKSPTNRYVVYMFYYITSLESIWEKITSSRNVAEIYLIKRVSERNIDKKMQYEAYKKYYKMPRHHGAAELETWIRSYVKEPRREKKMMIRNCARFISFILADCGLLWPDSPYELNLPEDFVNLTFYQKTQYKKTRWQGERHFRRN